MSFFKKKSLYLLSIKNKTLTLLQLKSFNSLQMILKPIISNIEYRISNIAYRISHIAYRISHIAYRPQVCKKDHTSSQKQRRGGILIA